MTKEAEVGEVASTAKTWTDGVLQCRLYGHEWQPSRAVHNRKARFFYIERICLRCLPEEGGMPTTKHEELSERGAILASWYTYAEGYLTQGIGRIIGEARDELRITTIERTFNMTRSVKQDARSSKTQQYIDDIEDGS